MLKTKIMDTLAENMSLKVLNPSILVLKPCSRTHVCKDDKGQKFSLNVLSFEWNADTTMAEVHAFLCNETKENIMKEVSYLLQYIHKEAKMVVKRIYP